MHHFADLWGREIPVGIGKVCFLAVQRPTLEEVLPEIACTGVKRIVIQPHLLFPGSLIAQIRSKVEAARQMWPASQWVVTGPLGPDRLLAEAVVAIASSQESLKEPAGSGCRN
jgi:sirohydrochlorin ferrochelatase